MKILEASRRATKGFMKGAQTYWGANLSEDRLESTRVTFMNDLGKAGVANAVLTQLSDTLDAAGESAEFDTTLRLFSALLDELCGSAESLAVPTVTEVALQTVKSLWQLSEQAEPSRRLLESALMTSDTPWDRFLRAATPNLPTYLSDWAVTGLHKSARFRRFCADSFWTISQKDRSVSRAGRKLKP
jgi:hypothetical protein